MTEAELAVLKCCYKTEFEEDFKDRLLRAFPELVAEIERLREENTRLKQQEPRP
jgi:hypothetical protein